MQRKSFAGMDCSVAQCLEVMGEWWTMLIIRDCFLGFSRFEDFQQRLGISRNILQARLQALVDHGVLERVPYSQHPPRDDYKLTAKGIDLWPVLTTMRQWGDKYAAPNGAPIVLQHRTCNHETTGLLVCDHCGGALEARGVSARAGKNRTLQSTKK